MSKTFDLIVVGAGPAGLMAAKTAGENNLTVALIERKKDITKWTRADCMMFYGLEGNFLGEDISVRVGKVTFPRNGFEVGYTGGLYPLYNWRVFSPCGHRIDFSSTSPIAAVFNKDILLRDLLQDAERAGVTVLQGALGVKVENTREGVKLLISRDGKQTWLTAKKLIAADGINSRITESAGLNEGRPLMGRFNVVQYIMDGIENPYPNSWVQFYGKSLSPFAPLHFLQTVHGEKLQKLGAIRPAPGNPVEDLKKTMKDSTFAPWFKNARIAYKMGVSVKAFMPIQNPVLGNVMSIGDAAAFAEVENQGGLMCGFHAANAVLKELSGENGCEAYIQWWQKSFEFLNPAVQQIAQGYAINPYYEDAEIDYLFSLLEGKPFAGTINQYKIPKVLWGAIFQQKERIDKEKPDLGKKIDAIHNMTVQEAFTVDT